MAELEQLEHLSMVSKVCTELDNHYNLNDKDLAEFIIDIAGKNPVFADFKRVLADNGAEFTDSFVENLLRIIKHMKPAVKAPLDPVTKADRLANAFPALARANDDIDHSDNPKEAKRDNGGGGGGDDLMAFFESMAPSSSSSASKRLKVKSRSRSRSRDRKKNDEKPHRCVLGPKTVLYLFLERLTTFVSQNKYKTAIF